RTVKKCLAKDPAKRWQTAADLRDELAWIAERGGIGESWQSTPGGLHRWKRPAWYSLTATTVFAALAITLAILHFREVPGDTRPVRLVIPAPIDVTYASWNLIESPPIVSPDGRQVAFVAHRGGDVDSVWLRPLDGLGARALTGTQGATARSAPFWSPDSQSLGFFADGKLKRIEISGGPPLVLADAPDARGGAWNEQGVILFAPNPA